MSPSVTFTPFSRPPLIPVGRKPRHPRCRRAQREEADRAPCVECGAAYVAVWRGGKRRATCSDACAAAHQARSMAAAREEARRRVAS